MNDVSTLETTKPTINRFYWRNEYDVNRQPEKLTKLYLLIKNMDGVPDPSEPGMVNVPFIDLEAAMLVAEKHFRPEWDGDGDGPGDLKWQYQRDAGYWYAHDPATDDCSGVKYEVMPVELWL
jgi:hypothetical protein